MKTTSTAAWPVLKRYDRNHLARIAMPLGGIGTGTVSLGGRGDLRDWEIMNRPAKGNRGPAAFFTLFAKAQGGAATARLLEGPLELDEYEGGFGSKAANHGLPRFRDCSFEAAYPLGQVLLSDPGVPVSVRLHAFNPLVPTDTDASGIPCAILRYTLTNRTARRVTASVCATLANNLGVGIVQGATGNRNAFRQGKGLQGIVLTPGNLADSAETWGTLAVATTANAGITHRTGWAKLSWGDSLLDFWDDFSADGRLDARDPQDVNDPKASLAVSLTLAPRATRSITFILAWHFPNRQTWTPKKPADGAPACACSGDPNRIGNYYTTQYRDAWDAAEKTARNLVRLEADTVRFVQAFCESNLPAVVKEAALFNVSTLRTQTCFRTPDGLIFGWEGCGDQAGCCHGTCTHVWNYEQATAFLFGDLAKAMRTVEFAHATTDDGLMSFRVNLPIGSAQEHGKAAADGQLGCIMKVYRDWQLAGDDAFLRTLWPKVRKAVEFCWIPGGWDADRDGVMEGCQHNTMDVEYYGPNPQMQAWYLGALRAAEEMAQHLGDAEFAQTCHGLFERGSHWMDEHLFNGEYYEHEVRPPASAESVAPALRLGMGAQDLSNPDLQLGAGCLVDQLVGQYMAHVCGLGYLLEPRQVKATLRAILKHNFRTEFLSHFNHLRSFVLGEESALLMATYPRGRRPKRPFPYFNEVMTGFEYAAAVHMLYEGQTASGLKCIQAIRDRYDGKTRSPFNEAECGHHYARAMASWAAVLALTGFHYSGVTGAMTFAAQTGTFFWSTGHAWGTCRMRRDKRGCDVRITVLGGKLRLRRLVLRDRGEHVLPRERTLSANATVEFRVPAR
ncbi:MAG: hypothetical protein A3K19_13810 [Lentisphaerae bacterium RIFOXYB12_FULL_65_16]|nr:MAG: hypothetical protein A3K18_00115 [Lentisphaerae bacterium RIFOXYA12_64_32]OGV84223.1 MAG: hypothetical protein A3K19_13810 [Lentisphaerae bacterium RIFOXYB12_FULL_65_16]